MFLARRMRLVDALFLMATLLPYPPPKRRLRLVALRPDLSASLLFHKYILTPLCSLIDDSYHKIFHMHSIIASNTIFLTTFITLLVISIKYGPPRLISDITKANTMPCMFTGDN